MLKNVGENILKKFAVIFFYTMDIKNTILNPKFYQHFLPSLPIRHFYICANYISRRVGEAYNGSHSVTIQRATMQKVFQKIRFLEKFAIGFQNDWKLRLCS